MKERPILFQGAMVRALLDGTKTQTRWIAKEFHGLEVDAILTRFPNHSGCPYGKPGEKLWVRETFAPILPQDPTYNGGSPIAYDYAATYKHGDHLGDSLGIKKIWKPSIHMPRAASRILLEIVSVRVERLQDITLADICKEGLATSIYDFKPATDGFRVWGELWDSINGAGSWNANPWCWAITFNRVTP